MHQIWFNIRDFELKKSLLQKEFPIGFCALLIAPIALLRGYIDAGGGIAGIYWGLALVMGFQFFCNLPAGIFASVVGAFLPLPLFNNLLYLALALVLALTTPINFDSGSSCDGFETEDRWGTVRCVAY